jgi:hypothetical protein
MAFTSTKRDWDEDFTLSNDEMNRIENNVEALKSEDLTIGGTKTFTSGLVVNNIEANTIEADTIQSASGRIEIAGVELEDGIIYGTIWGA